MKKRFPISKHTQLSAAISLKKTLLGSLAIGLGLTTACAHEVHQDSKVQEHYPLLGVDTAGVFLLRNASTADVGWAFAGFILWCKYT